jgi:glycosyltransferase involved in cell wall biosynthesis
VFKLAEEREATRTEAHEVLRAADGALRRAPSALRRLRLLVAHNAPREPNGGMSRIMTFIHERVAREAGHSVEFFCSEDVPAWLPPRAARHAFPLLVLRHAAAAARRGRPYDLINVHEPASAPVTTFKRLAGSPAVVVTSHGLERRAWQLALEEARIGREGPALKTRVFHPLTSLWQSEAGLRRADHVFCLNFEDRDFLREQTRLPASKLTRIYPAADTLFSEAARGRDYARRSRLLFAATWRKNKGIEDLVPAFTTLAERHGELELIVLGAGVSEGLVRAAFPERVRGRVSCARAASEAETAGWFARSDIYVLPSLFEGTPLTLMEAMASGLPVVTTATCGMRDVVRDGETGLLVPVRSPGEIVAAVERLLGDERLRERLGRAAQKEAGEKYTWERVAAPVAEVYERLCARRNGHEQ